MRKIIKQQPIHFAHQLPVDNLINYKELNKL